LSKGSEKPTKTSSSALPNQLPLANASTQRPLLFCDFHGKCYHSTAQCRKFSSQSSTKSNQPLSNVKNFESYSRKPGPNLSHPTVANCTAEEDSESSNSEPTCANILGAPEKTKEWPKLISLPVEINGQQIFAHLDTGSQISLIDSELAKQLNLSILPTAVSAMQAQAECRLTIHGCSKDTQITFNSQLFAQDLYATELNPEMKLLLGMDAFKSMNLFIGGIDSVPTEEEKIIDLPPEEIPLPSEARTKFLEEINCSLHTNANVKGFCNHPDSIVHLNTGANPPSFVHQYPIPMHLRNLVTEQVAVWLQKGIITFSTPGCCWNSALLVVKKQTPAGSAQKYRVCEDPRHLNEKLEDDKYPIPLLRSILDKAGGATVFSALDLENSYHQFAIQLSDQQKTSFTWNGIQYMFVGAPFGIKTLSSIFQRVLSQLLAPFAFAVNFIDDILIFSRSIEEHSKHVQIIIESLTAANLKLNTFKCKFAYNKIHVLGHIISAAGITLDPEKAERAINWLPLTSGEDVQSFLGLTNYFRDFIPNYAQISKPLDQLRFADKFTDEWGPIEENAFLQLKNALIAPPTLAFFNQSYSTYLASDASNFAIGGTLFQLKDSNANPAESNSPKQFIKFASRALTKTERNYSATKRELLAIVFCLMKFENYLLGSAFTVLCDHKPLSFLTSQKRLSELHNTWLETLLRFNFKIIYIPGPLNILPDKLSRLSFNCLPSNYQICAAISAQSAFSEDQLLQSAIQSGKTIPAEASRPQILQEIHAQSHEGGDTMYKKCIDANLFWPRLKNDCDEAASSCSECLKYTITKRGFHPQTSVLSSQPMSHVAIDLLGPLNQDAKSNQYILVMIDLFSRFIFLRALANKTAEDVAQALFSIFCDYGHPRIIQSDNGTEFVNQLMAKLTALYSWTHRRVVPYHPQGNGAVERAVGTTLSMLRKHLNGKLDWSAELPAIQLRINLRRTDLLNSCPFEIMFSRALNPFTEHASEEFIPPTLEQVESRITLIQEVIQPALTELMTTKSSKRNAQWNASHHLIDFPINSVVVVRNNAPLNKLDLRYLGPYRIVARTRGGSYILEDGAGNKLKRHFPPNLLKKSNVLTLTDSFQVEQLLDWKVENGIDLFKVRWFGYGPDDDSWEPASSFDDPAIVYNFKATHKSKGE
jgi:hypothetical protein